MQRQRAHFEEDEVSLEAALNRAAYETVSPSATRLRRGIFRPVIETRPLVYLEV